MAVGALRDAVAGTGLAGTHALVLVPNALQRQVCRAIAPFDLRLEFVTELPLFVARIESDYPAVLIVDADLAGSLAALSSFARSLRPDMTIVAVTYCWSERDDELRSYTDAILHKPPRCGKWQAALDRLGLPRTPFAPDTTSSE